MSPHTSTAVVDPKKRSTKEGVTKATFSLKGSTATALAARKQTTSMDVDSTSVAASDPPSATTSSTFPVDDDEFSAPVTDQERAALDADTDSGVDWEATTTSGKEETAPATTELPEPMGSEESAQEGKEVIPDNDPVFPLPTQQRQPTKALPLSAKGKGKLVTAVSLKRDVFQHGDAEELTDLKEWDFGIDTFLTQLAKFTSVNTFSDTSLYRLTKDGKHYFLTALGHIVRWGTTDQVTQFFSLAGDDVDANRVGYYTEDVVDGDPLIKDLHAVSAVFLAQLANNTPTLRLLCNHASVDASCGAKAMTKGVSLSPLAYAVIHSRSDQIMALSEAVTLNPNIGDSQDSKSTPPLLIAAQMAQESGKAEALEVYHLVSSMRGLNWLKRVNGETITALVVRMPKLANVASHTKPQVTAPAPNVLNLLDQAFGPSAMNVSTGPPRAQASAKKVSFTQGSFTMVPPRMDHQTAIALDDAFGTW